MGIVVDGLATARLTRLVTEDVLTRPLRERVTRAVDGGYLPEMAESFLSCPWCVSVWIGAGVAVARRVAPRTWAGLAAALAASEVAGFLVAASSE